MRSEAIPPALAHLMRGCMGIRLDNPPPDWVDAIAIPSEEASE